MDFETFLQHPPTLHQDMQGNPQNQGLDIQPLEFIYQNARNARQTLETGAGLSTVAFAFAGSNHICICPDSGQFERIQAYCRENGVATDRLELICGDSADILPGLECAPLDFALIDGRHGFPSPAVDWYYICRRLKVGGVLVMDDLQLWTVRQVYEFMKNNTGWKPLIQLGRTAAFMKTDDKSHLQEWNLQNFVASMSQDLGLPEPFAPAMTAKDHTGEYDYEALIQEEKAHYSEIEVTDRLTEGGIHDAGPWVHYWKKIGEKVGSNAPEGGNVAALVQASTDADPIRVLSLGSGYCGQEIMLAKQFARPYEILCTDVNEALFEQAKKTADEQGLHLTFETADLNFMEIEAGSYDLIFAHAVMHHVINLEHLFQQIHRGLKKNGLFHLVDVCGENRRLLWEKNREFANTLLELCPKDPEGGGPLSIPPPAVAEGMEGVRQEEIIPFLESYFDPVFEFRHGAFMRFICLDAKMARALDPLDEKKRRHLDFLIESDLNSIQCGLLDPLEIWGIYQPH